jgi:hypothetical protein
VVENFVVAASWRGNPPSLSFGAAREAVTNIQLRLASRAGIQPFVAPLCGAMQGRHRIPENAGRLLKAASNLELGRSGKPARQAA